MSLRFTVLDAFTNMPFGGNPAAVILLPHDHKYPDSTLLGIAKEFNISETAYIVVPSTIEVHETTPNGGRHVELGLRWFTPVGEVALCGHATLCSSAAVFSDESLIPPNVNEIRFSTLSGMLTARRVPSQPPKYEVHLPAGTAVPTGEEAMRIARKLAKNALGEAVKVLSVAVSPASPYTEYILIEIDNNVPLKELHVVSSAFVSDNWQFTLFMVTQCNVVDESTNALGFDYRVFAPAWGVTEDPVCGSAIAFAASSWVAKVPPQVDALTGEPVSKVRAVSARGGEIDVVCDGAVVKLRGEVRVASRGEIFL
ncbi:hypothetical protein PIIN_01595 [Serendipita indica DSM 11827]|uniref:Diaminopimelate epimerase-like protein n=1 Tax=Serendipita indica (strain DSM 11827) TaxID=1109443 RepID=G4T8W2_SERID|nr:hypothetical protein PIIN_01595 [Serendipita indica DSM 11827]